MAKNNIKRLSYLESEIMEIIWKAGSASVRDVLLEMEKKRKIAYTTVMTVMSRLHEKEVLKRKMNGQGAYDYNPTLNKEEFLASASRNAIKSLLKEFGEVAVAQFIDTIESSDEESLKRLRKKLIK